jgi:GNAT superfamily N-acetyltransferase
MNNKTTIRYAVENDVPVILKLIKELAEYEKLSDKVKATEADLKRVLFGENKFVEVLIAEYAEVAIGYAIFFKNFSTFVGKPGIYLEDIYVKPELRGKGIGKALLEKIIALAKERNFGRVEWCVLDWNTPAINFYKKLGAKDMNEWTTFRLEEDKF